MSNASVGSEVGFICNKNKKYNRPFVKFGSHSDNDINALPNILRLYKNPFYGCVFNLKKTNNKLACDSEIRKLKMPTYRISNLVCLVLNVI